MNALTESLMLINLAKHTQRLENSLALANQEHGKSASFREKDERKMEKIHNLRLKKFRNIQCHTRFVSQVHGSASMLTSL